LFFVFFILFLKQLQKKTLSCDVWNFCIYLSQFGNFIDDSLSFTNESGIYSCMLLFFVFFKQQSFSKYCCYFQFCIVCFCGFVICSSFCETPNQIDLLGKFRYTICSLSTLFLSWVLTIFLL